MSKYVLFPITPGSDYLTIGTVLEKGEDKIKVQNISTPASTWTSLWREINEPKKLALEDRLGKAVDCIGRVIRVGDFCLYLHNKEILEGIVEEINSELWVTVDGIKIRNVSTYII